MNRFCIITIDTEGDNLWEVKNTNAAMSRITNANGEFIERFQLLCEKYGMIPTYLTNYEMAISKPFVETARAALSRKTCEVGMHLHAFNNPPFYELSNRGGKNKAYAGEYPTEVLEQKIDYITKLLEDTFQTSVTSHRGGRWYLSSEYLKILKDKGYFADCTVTPGIDWTFNHGQTLGSKGANFKGFPGFAYEISFENLRKKGITGMIEVPVTIGRVSIKEKLKEKLPFSKSARVSWLRPNGKNLGSMKALVEENLKDKKTDYIEFMLHSSELMPGGSPLFQTEGAIDALYNDMEEFFSYIKDNYIGIGLSDYAKRVLS